MSAVPSLLYTLYLMTYSDIKSILLPQTLFGISNALAAPVFGVDSRTIPQPASILSRLPLTALWVWINLLLFTIENQRQTSSIEEDKLNKPWRPIPAGRITQSQMESWRLRVYCAAFAVSYWIGGLVQCVALMVSGYAYNNVGGGSKSALARNLINSLGYISFSTGAMEVALGKTIFGLPCLSLTEMKHSFTLFRASPTECALLHQWFAVLICILFCTTHAQDMEDQPGDAVRGRRTVPLVIGDLPARVSICSSVGLCSALCSWFWSPGAWVSGFVVGLAAVVGLRTMVFRSVRADKKTFLIWNAWLSSLYLLPFWTWCAGGL
ncbi:hypothetical protein DM02DRAFT_593889 [Periconia macrospinosa]|uniref:UbiA prenyltransferase n=1 Tax=Periconia macrospinosa TaxID=97972 RepID=A0A2V1DP60_9PLEO|nr:hypothetical protein DM02DRAFT_593889 [Periconia macrospinosa]